MSRFLPVRLVYYAEPNLLVQRLESRIALSNPRLEDDSSPCYLLAI